MDCWFADVYRLRRALKELRRNAVPEIPNGGMGRNCNIPSGLCEICDTDISRKVHTNITICKPCQIKIMDDALGAEAGP